MFGACGRLRPSPGVSLLPKVRPRLAGLFCPIALYGADKLVQWVYVHGCPSCWWIDLSEWLRWGAAGADTEILLVAPAGVASRRSLDRSLIYSNALSF